MARVIMLGTGDPLNPERAQSSLAMPLGGGETMLFDTSSGTILLRRLEDAGIALAGIRHIFVSHRHFDHAGGLAPLLTTLASVREAELTVYAPPVTLRALHDILTLTIPGVEDWLGARLRWHELADGTAIVAGSATVTPFDVDHTLECTGFRITQGGTTIVFSADTRPCPWLVDNAREADLLIHEAYGLDVNCKEAHTFGHSTAADAGTAARSAGVRRLLLTHFRASRHADPIALGAEAEAAFGHPVELACDLDVVGA